MNILDIIHLPEQFKSTETFAQSSTLLIFGGVSQMQVKSLS